MRYFDPEKQKHTVEYLNRLSLNMKVGFTAGTFDLFHSHHLRFLTVCWTKCDYLVVGVDSDALVAVRKGKERPIIPQEHRLAIVTALRGVQATFLMQSYDQFWQLVRDVNPAVIFKNKPFHFDHGANVELIPDVDGGTSTTGLIAKIRGNTEQKEGVG
jgi:cytidyltransferase-like protein